MSLLSFFSFLMYVLLQVMSSIQDHSVCICIHSLLYIDIYHFLLYYAYSHYYTILRYLFLPFRKTSILQVPLRETPLTGNSVLDFHSYLVSTLLESLFVGSPVVDVCTTLSFLELSSPSPNRYTSLTPLGFLSSYPSQPHPLPSATLHTFAILVSTYATRGDVLPKRTYTSV